MFGIFSKYYYNARKAMRKFRIPAQSDRFFKIKIPENRTSRASIFGESPEIGSNPGRISSAEHGLFQKYGY
jgi:hypothetical protein